MRLARFPGVRFDSRCVALLALGVAASLFAGAFAPLAAQDAQPPAPQSDPASSGGDDVVAYINEYLRQGWEAYQVTPSPRASDEEFIRRVYLDIVGHTPPVEDVLEFLSDDSPEKRTRLVDRLLDDDDYVTRWTTIWTNLLIGRATPDNVSREGLQRWLRECFARNRPYNEMVFELVSAEGISDYGAQPQPGDRQLQPNGAVNFLLAHLNDEAVPATSHTSRIFLGVQVQCTQCHNHPFNDWKQDQFWQFNSFFRQATSRRVRQFNPQTGRDEDLYFVLQDNNAGGGVYFEQRNGLMRFVMPEYDGVAVEPSSRRRLELARLITDPERPQMARAIVNRMWGHFFGYGFTRPVDDMGPHNQPTHPELLDRLAADFIRSGYDLKQLIRWITASDAYNLTSSFGPGNRRDDPSIGETPLFSRMYLKQMDPEQLFDSLIVATHADRAGRSDWEEVERQRQQWLQQFVIAFGTDENDETTTFNGTIPQALMMMNGELIRQATNCEPGSFLHDVLSADTAVPQKIDHLYLAALSRRPLRTELQGAQQIFRYANNNVEALQDVFWALLNSNEFILNH